MYKNQLRLLILIMITVSLLVTSLSIILLYRNTIAGDERVLWDMVESHALVLEAIYKENHNVNETLKIFTEANNNYSGIGETGEFNLTRLENDNIVYLMARDKFVLTNPKPVSFRNGILSEPARRGLSGRSGTMVGLDDRGVLVLSAYRPLRNLNWAIGAKMDMREIRAPFITASIISIVVMILLTMIGAFLFISITQPMILKIEENDLKLRQELKLGREVQLSTLPKQAPEIPGISVTARYIPMEEIGGDLYDFIQISDELAGFFIADVSGHGIPAALIASMVKVVLSIQTDNAAHPEMMLKEISNTLSKEWNEHFLTALYVCMDSRKLTIANAGHVPLLIFRKNPDEILSFKPTGGIISWISDNNFETKEIGLLKGDRIIMYTDGITEASNSRDELYGKERFKQFILTNGSLGNNDFIDHLMNDIKHWRGKDENEDDMTIIVIDVL